MQTKKGSLFETCCNVMSGLILAYFTWTYIMIPLSVSFSWDMNTLQIKQVFLFNGIFTLISIVRGYFWRRLFNWLEVKKIVQ